MRADAKDWGVGLRDRAATRRMLASSLAIAAALAAGPARGAGFNATITQSVNVTAPRTPVTVGTTNYDEQISVNASNAVIDWTPTTGDFLPSGAKVLYSGANNFTVLNEVASPSAAIHLNGQIDSQVNGAQGGNIWFYNPGGIIVGGTAVFNVGSLLLTADKINYTTSGGAFSAGYGTVDFTGAPTIQFRDSGYGSAVTINANAQINADNGYGSAYVALVAPRVNQGGTVNVNGSAGYLALASADVTIHSDTGLFDISPTFVQPVGTVAQPVQGTTPTTPGETILSHTGTTNVGNPTSGTFSHNVYLVAIPKNDAVTMLVSGQLGYQTATSATIVNGKIILDAGAIPLASGQDQALTSLPAAALSVTGGTFNAPVVATATGDANIAAENADLTAPYSFNVTGFGSLGLAAANGHTLDIGGLLAAGTDAVSLLAVGGNDINIDSTGGSTLEIRQNLLAKSVGDAGDGGDIAFNVADAGSSARVEGNLTLDTHSGENSSSLAPIIATQGGSAAIDVSGGGALTVVGATNLLAQGTGAIGPGVANSTASGGTASISASSGTVTLGATTLNVSATGGHDSSGTFASGSAFGGTPDGGGASINATTGGIITIGGVLNVDAAATVTSNSPAPTATSDGGYISVSADNGGNVKVTGTSFSLDADANQGQATGGNVFVTANSGGSVTLPAGSITANGTSGGINDDGVGAVGQGGTITLGASGGALSIGALHASANGTGASATNSVGGIGYGGSIGITADSGGTISLASGAFTVSGTGGLGIDGDGGTGYGGTIAIGANSGGIISLASGTFYAPGYGGGVSTGSGSFGYGAGVGYGGSVAITLDDGGFSASGPVELRASGVGGNAPNVVSSDGYGGTASITVTNSDAGASPALVANFGGGVVVGAGGFGGNGYGGSVASDGGSGFGGGIVSGTSGAFITASSSGVITGAGTFDVGAGGFGGQGYGGGVGGNATGGIAAITASGGSINTGSGSVHVGAAGMAAAAGAFGGFGQGGSASVTISSSGSLSVGALTLNAGGVGGDTLLSGPSAFGGNGTGGTGLIDISGGGTLTTIGDLRLYIDGHGGNGAGDRSLIGNEGNGTGGNATLSVANGSATVGGSLYISAGGDGEAHDDGTTGDERGDGVTATINGGTGTGGTARLQVGDSGSVQVASLLDVSARGVGGRGWDGGSGGAGIGGLAAISVTDTSSSGASIAFGSLTQTADGIGGAGGNGNNGYGIGSFAGGAGGFGQGGSATLDVAGGIFGNGAGSLSLSAAGTGGHGGTGVDGTNASYGVAGTDGTAGGIGGDAQGGQVSVTASNGGVISDPFGFDGSLSLNVNATGGIGGIGGRGGAPYTDVSASNNQPGGVGGIGGAGGSALAGNLLLEEDSAGIGFESSYFQATATAGTAGITGRDGDGAFSQPDSSGGSATGGIVTINAFGTDGEIALGSSTITADATASGSGSFGSFTAGQIAINVTGTPDPSFDTPYALSAFSLYASNGGSTLSTGEGGASGFTLTASSTPVALGDTYITGAGDAVFDLANGAYVSAGSFDVERPGAVNAPGNILITQTDAEDAPYALDTASTTLNASGNVDFTGSSLRSSEGTTILAGEQNQVDGNFYGGNITGGDIVTTGDFNYSPTINLTANAGSNNAGDITLANVSSADAVNVYADGSATFTSVLAGTDAVDIGDTDAYDYSGAILISAANGITISNVAAAYNAIDLISQNGGVSASALFAGTRTGPDDVIFAAGTGGDDGSIAILAPGDVTIDTIQAPGFLYIGGTDALNGQFTGLGTGTVESDVQPYMGAPDRSDAVSLLTGGPQLTSGDITLGSNGGSLSVGSASIGAGNTLTLNADLTTTSGDATLIAGQPLVAGNANFDIAGTLFIRTVSGGITIGTAQAGTDIVLLPSFGSESASANIVAGDLTAGRDVVAINDFFTDSPSSADRSITAGDIQAGDDILLAAYDSVHTGSLTTTGQGQDLSQSASVFTTVPGSGILVTGSTGVTVGTVDSIDDVTIANVNHYGETVDPTGVPVPSDTVLLSARGSLTTGDITTGSALSLENQGGAVSVGAVAVGSAEIDATGAITLGGDFTTNNGDATLTAGDDIVLSNDIVNVGGLADFEADGDIVGTGATVTATTIDFSAAGTISGGNYTSTGSDASLSGDEGIDVGSVSAGDSVDLVSSDGDVTAGALIAGTNPSFDSDEFDGAIGIVALGNIDIASGRAYGDIGIDSVSGSVTAPTLTAGFRSDDSATNGEEIAVLGQGAIDLGTVSAPGLLYVGGPSSLPLSAIGDDPTAQDIRDNLAATPTPSGASVSIDTATVGSAYVNAGTSLTASDGFTTTIGDATLYATGAITGGDFHIAGTGLLSAVGSVDIGSVNAGTDLLVAAAGVGGSGTAITTGDLQAGRDLNAVVFEIPGTGVASQNVRLGDLTAGDDVVLGATGTLTAGTVYATGLGQDGTSFTGFAADSGGSNISLGSGNGMSIGAIEAPGTVTLVNRSETDSNGFQYAPGTGDIGVGSITAGGHLTVTNNGGAISLAGASAANTDFSAGGDVAATGPIESGSEVNVTSGGDIIFTSVTAGDAVRLIANAGGVSVDSIVAGTDAADVSGSFGFGDIGISAQADVHVGSGTAYGSIALLARDGAISSDTLTAGNRTDGSATAGGQVVLLADGTINAGSITAPGRLYVGGPAAVGDATVDTDETAQEIIAALDPNDPATGSDVFLGATTVGAAQINAGGSLTTSGTFVTTTGGAQLIDGGELSGGDFVIARNFRARSSGAVIIGGIQAGQDIALTAAVGDHLDTGALTAGRDVYVGGGDVEEITLGNVSAGRDVAVATNIPAGSTAIGSLNTGSVTAGDDIQLTSCGALTTGALKATGQGADGTAIGASGTQNLPGSSIALASGHGMSVTSLDATGNITLTNSTTPLGTNGAAADGRGSILVTDHIAAGGTLTATNQLGGIQLAGITAPNGVTATGTTVALGGAGDLHVIDADATAGSVMLSANGDLTVDAAEVSNSFLASATGDMMLPTLNVPGSIVAAAHGDVTAHDLTAVDSIMVASANG
ncbi:MAG: filamentous hemagglutinin N-terminal domain-containing protein, partial [Sphingomonadaceae bacterium]|nr:filamentous hemagglutinin N-terminal domain-containing protein [Sphingomonadaceae bacterium]